MPPAPLLLLHGFLGRGADWDGFRETLNRAAAASGLHLGPVSAPDLPGHGDAVRLPPERYTMAGATDALADRLDAPADIVGYSMGGRVALALALRHPERVRRLVLLSASPGLDTEAERAERRRLDAERADAVRHDLAGFASRWQRLPLFAHLPDAVRRARAAEQARNDPDEIARALAGLGTGAQPSYWGRLAALPPGTLAVAGERDAKFVGIARRMEARADGRVRAVALDGVGHAPHLEAPEATATLVLGALYAGASPGAPR